MEDILSKLVIASGAVQFAVVAGSLAVPYLLNWRGELVKVQTLIKQIFWTYAGYILCTNLFFAIVSVFATEGLLDGSRLATALNVFIALYWAARLVIQFVYFDKKGLPVGGIYRIGEWMLVICFIFLTAVYSWAACWNEWGMAQ
jgi:hypothetical protein